MPAAVPRPKQRTPELRDHVLKVAMVTLARDGVIGFTTRKVAEEARTSTPAVYELFGDKAGLVREVFYEGFRELQARFEGVTTDDPEGSLVGVLAELRAFIRKNPVLGEVMFAKPFSEFEPGPCVLDAAACPRAGVTRLLIERVRACLDAGKLKGDEVEIAQVLLSLTQGLAATEAAGWIPSAEEADRRWDLAVRALLAGLRS